MGTWVVEDVQRGGMVTADGLFFVEFGQGVWCISRIGVE